jgi:hypothetical protein
VKGDPAVLTISLELVCIACIATFAFLVWPPFVFLAVGIAAGLIAWVRS